MKEIIHFGEVVIDGRIVLGLIFEKGLSAIIWLLVQSSDRPLYTRSR
jgi:hypothetical protein